MNATATAIDPSLDNYPSRQPGQSARVIPRQEPVIHTSHDCESVLSVAQLTDYDKQGFLFLDSLFADEEVSQWQTEVERLRHDPAITSLDETITEPGSQAVRSVFAVHKLSKLIARIASDPRLVAIAQYLLGDQVYLHQSRLNYKPGFKGKDFYWHSDFETWHVEDGMPAMRALSMSISLTPNYSTNGPLLLIPGSHKKFLACEGETPEAHFKTSLKQQRYGVPDDDNLQQLVANHDIVEFLGGPGSVCVFDCNTMHGSNSNISPAPRSNLFFVYNALSNRVGNPYSGQAPRPDYICTRESIKPIHYPTHQQGLKS